MYHLRNYGIPIVAVFISLLSISHGLSLGTLRKREKHHFTRRRRDGDEAKPAPEEWFDLLTPVGSDSSAAEEEIDNETMVVNRTSSLLDLHRLTHDSSHCLNGGIGFLGSFCLCPDDFIGQYCEREIKGSCNIIPHDGEWIYLDCSLCKCVAGLLECTPHHLEGCEEKEEERQRKLASENNGQVRHNPHPLVLYTAFGFTLFWTLDPVR